MQRHILAPIAASGEFDGLRFPAFFFRHKENVRITVFHVGERPNLHFSDAATKKELALALRQEASLREKADRALAEATAFLENEGFLRENIAGASAVRKRDPAEDIAALAKKGRFDVISLGHGGATALDALYRRSIALTLLESPLETPLWISRWPAKDARNVLVCADGSPESVRAAGHAAYMLAGEPDHEIHILHVRDPAKDKPRDARMAVDAALAAVVAGGFPESRVRVAIKQGEEVVRIIRERLRQHGYAAAAVGRSGADMPSRRAFFTGSLPRVLLRELEGCALWAAQ